MKRVRLSYFAAVLCLTLAASATALAQGKNVEEGAKQARKAASVFKEIMDIPEKAIPNSVLDDAECVAVFPDVIKAGFIVGGRGGRGVASCRTASGWSAPAYFSLKGGSFGLQIGGSSTDFVLLFMNEKAMNSLLSSKFTMGGEASVAAGPVGRQAAAETDAKFNAEILSYSRSKGVFAGLELKGTSITPDHSDMEDTYGKGVKAVDVIKTGRAKSPVDVQIYPDTLTRYSKRRATK